METVWLIELGQLYLGAAECNSFPTKWVGPNEAIRFRNKCDAEAVKKALRLPTAIVTEHQWIDAQLTPRDAGG